MTHTDAIAAFIATHGTNAPGMFITFSDDPTSTDDAAFAVLFADVHTDSDVDEIVDEIDEMLGN